MNETKLGQLIDQNAGRDAVHVALAPMQAAERLAPGQHVGFVDDNRKLAGPASKTIGIVDPYLRSDVEKDQWFFLCLYPQTTTGLRHVWTHPAFSDNAPLPHQKSDSVKYLEGVAASCDITFNFLMEAAQRFIETGDALVQQGMTSWRDGFPYPADEFWRHYEAVTGNKPKNEDADRSIFCCTC